MLSIDAARAAGFRDSLYFFRRNPLIHKLSCSQSEKDRLIELGKLSGNLKSRAVTMVSAKNCFKVMGATFIQSAFHSLSPSRLPLTLSRYRRKICVRRLL